MKYFKLWFKIFVICWNIRWDIVVYYLKFMYGRNLVCIEFKVMYGNYFEK